ncbi:MAG: ABC transporter permease [Desulfurococcus sp.]|uniref:ABC transporter permease n=1 Tax=Desulfurococcus sp. TaxID=51678 RepID=UPI003D0B9B34
MPGAGYYIARRGVVLLVSYVAIIIIIAAILELSGYATQIYQAVINELVRADVDALVKARQGQVDPAYIQEYRQNRTIEYMKQYGLIDENGNPVPSYVRMWKLAFNALTFNFGKTKEDLVAMVVPTMPPASITYIISVVLPRTIIVVTVGELIVVAIALLVGPRIAYRHGTFLDRVVVAYAALTSAIPLWWLAMLFIRVFGYQLGWFPTSLRGVTTPLNNFWSNPAQNFVTILWYITPPLTVFTVISLGGWLYGIRAMVLRIVREDYVMVAKAKGLPERDITRKYVMRPSLAPILTNVILALAGTLGGMIITESVFDWPGMGTLYYAAITTGDAETIVALFVIYVGVYLIARFILEILYVLVDPRVRVR